MMMPVAAAMRRWRWSVVDTDDMVVVLRGVD